MKGENQVLTEIRFHRRLLYLFPVFFWTYFSLEFREIYSIKSICWAVSQLAADEEARSFIHATLGHIQSSCKLSIKMSRVFRCPTLVTESHDLIMMPCMFLLFFLVKIFNLLLIISCPCVLFVHLWRLIFFLLQFDEFPKRIRSYKDLPIIKGPIDLHNRSARKQNNGKTCHRDLPVNSWAREVFKKASESGGLVCSADGFAGLRYIAWRFIPLRYFGDSGSLVWQ
jgi:hypothetical protein